MDAFIDCAGPLGRVRGTVCGHGRYAELVFAFADRELWLSCNDDTDEIEVEVRESVTTSLADLSDKGPFRELLGMALEGAWMMENHRGYNDAFQVRFLNTVTREEATRQFEVAASSISVGVVATD